jgi:hypothetical protein
MWDELILVWNIKLLLKENKKIYVACSNKDWLINFHKQFLEKYNLEINEKWFYNKETWEQTITYLQELPKWFRSTIKFLKNIKDLKEYFKTDSILIWGWEIFTEETPGSYWYWLASVWFLLFWRNLYLSGWIQIPIKIWNKIPFLILNKKAKKLLVRDYDLQNSKHTPKWLKNKVEFFPDTSIFVYDNIDLKNYKWKHNFKNEQKIIETDKNWYLENNTEKKEYTPYIVINVNKRAEKFLDKIKEIIDKYKQNCDIYFVPVCKSPKDMDIKYYHMLKENYPAMKLLDWENWEKFIEKLALAEQVYTCLLYTSPSPRD